MDPIRVAPVVLFTQPYPRYTLDGDTVRFMNTGLRGPSRTALMAAMGRALHCEGPADEIERMLVHHGYRSVTHFGVEDAVRRYFGGVDVGMPDVQRLATAVVA